MTSKKVLAVVMAMLAAFGALAGTMTANAAVEDIPGVTLVSGGFAQCAELGYATFGWEDNYGASWWGMDAGHNGTNYVAYRLIQDGVETPINGHARDWPDNAQALGLAVDQFPAVGATAQWNAYESGFSSQYGQVAYVEEVGAGYIVITYDAISTPEFRWLRIDSTSPAWPGRFIHFEEHAAGGGPLPGGVRGYGPNGKFLGYIEPPAEGSIPISNRAELDAVRENRNGSFHLVADIDLSGEEWEPISYFAGRFDGQGHIIKNMKIRADIPLIGLFGNVAYGAIIKNIGMEGTDISVKLTYQNGSGGHSYVGSLIGSSGQYGWYQSGTTIFNCYNEGVINVECNEIWTSGSTRHMPGVTVGGIVGSGANVVYSYNTADITVNALKGSACGIGPAIAAISRCYNTGNIRAKAIHDMRESITSSVYGIGSGHIFRDCFNTGTLQSTSYNSYSSDYTSCTIAGIGGSHEVNRCYNAGSVLADTAKNVYYCGGISQTYDSKHNYVNTPVGDCMTTACLQLAPEVTGMNLCLIAPISTHSSLSNNFALNTTTGDAIDDTGDGSGGNMITETQARQQGTYEDIDWDFEHIWQMPAGGGYPVLRKQPTFIVSFDANGGEGAPESQLKIFEKDFVYQIPLRPTRAGYNFQGWTTYATNVYYLNGVTHKEDHPVTFYAVWKPITYSVRYNASGGSGTTMANTTHTYDVAATLRKNTYTRSGMVFTGWATAVDGPVLYSDQQSVANLSATQGEIVNLYAVWVNPGETTTTAPTTTSTTTTTMPSTSTTTTEPTPTSPTTTTTVPTTSTTTTTTAMTTTTAPTTTTTTITQPPPPVTGIFGTNPKWYGAWWHYILFFVGFGFIWMWF